MGCFPVFSHFECARVPDVSRGAVAHTPPAASSTISDEQASLGKCVCMLKCCVCGCLCCEACLTLCVFGSAMAAVATRLVPAALVGFEFRGARKVLPWPLMGNVTVEGTMGRGAIVRKR